jgi:hypothetical protein
LSQLWVFIVGAPRRGVLAAVFSQFLYPTGEQEATVAPAREEQAGA